MRQALLAEPASLSGIFHVRAIEGRIAQLAHPEHHEDVFLPVGASGPNGGDSKASLLAGDVVRLNAGLSKAAVCFRPSDRHHTLFVTNQCNSRCLMCSQPPTPQADEWLFDEAMEIVSLIEGAPAVLGITGGEPTLHAERLRELLDFIGARFPETRIEVLTNGRRLSEDDIAYRLLSGLPSGRVTWLVPLYGPSDEVHDFVVQSPGAFDETLACLLNLQAYGQRIQLRTVLVRPVIEHLQMWAEFVGRNLPFVDAVALMASEPIGFALANEEACVVDVAECIAQLSNAVEVLSLHGLRCVLMNMPLCKLPTALRPLASMSISDWKNDYAPECGSCDLRRSCAGFFTWHKTSIYRAGLKPIRLIPHTERGFSV